MFGNCGPIHALVGVRFFCIFCGREHRMINPYEVLGEENLEEVKQAALKKIRNEKKDRCQICGFLLTTPKIDFIVDNEIGLLHPSGSFKIHFQLFQDRKEMKIQDCTLFSVDVVSFNEMSFEDSIEKLESYVLYILGKTHQINPSWREVWISRVERWMLSR